MKEILKEQGGRELNATQEMQEFMSSRMKAILLYDDGYNCLQIARKLSLSVESINQYITDYMKLRSQVSFQVTSKKHYQAHVTAIIYDGAQIGSGSIIGPYSVIGPKVVIGENNIISPHVVIDGKTQIGSGNKIYQFASIGSVPQDQKWQGHDTCLQIGDNNQIREYVTIQPATSPDGLTQIGNNNLFMACSHIAHDVRVGNNCWFANSACIAGHATVGNNVVFGGMSGVHQNVVIGDLSMIAAGSMVAQDVPPFANVQGDRARLFGINKVGLQRAGYAAQDVSKIHNIFRKLFYHHGIMEQKLVSIEGSYPDCALTDKICSFIRSSVRGVCRY